MKKNSQIIFMSLCLALACSACTVHSNVDSDLGTPLEQKLDAGLEGTWSTGCTYSQGVYQTDAITFHGSIFEDNVALYQNSTCTGAPASTAKATGTLSVVARDFFYQNGYDVNLSVRNQAGALETHYITTLIESGKLYLPSPTEDTTRNRPLYIDRTRPYTKVGN